MDIKPVAWMLDVESCTSMSAPLAQASRGGNYADPLYDQSAIDALTAEVRRLTAANIAYAEQVAKLIGRAGNAEAEAVRLRSLLDGQES